MDVGLSIWMGLQATALFLIFVFLHNLDFTLSSLPVLYVSLVSLVVSLASHPSVNTPMLLCKKQDGTFPIWSLIVFSPYLYFVRIFTFLRRFTSGEEPYNEICEGVCVGGWPCSADKLPPGNPAIIDCTCEFPRKKEFKGLSYLCIPTWDTRAPQPGEIESAVKWAIRKRAQNVPVYIHCAYGHGRSVAVMCALLVALGVVEDWKKAEQFIRERRPYISMNSNNYKALEEWSRDRLSTPSINEVNSSSAVTSTSSGRSRAGRPKNRSGKHTSLRCCRLSFQVVHMWLMRPLFLFPCA